MSAKRRQPFARLTWRRTEPPSAEPARLFPWIRTPGERHVASWAGRLVLGDNLRVMAALESHHAGQIGLIYADPPFLTGNTYSARVGHGEDSRRPATWNTTDGYADRWQDGANYLSSLNQRLQAMYRLLAPTGSLYLHLDWHASAYARVMLDEIFGPDRLLNEIVWVYHGPSPIRSAFKRKHDTILVYTKSADYVFNADEIRMPYNPATRRTFASSPKAGFGKIPDLERGKVPEDWWYFPVVARLHRERTGFPTQKPEALLERIICASSNPGDLVADFYCGSGTTAAVASRLGRRWIAVDDLPLAIHTTRRRLLMQSPVPQFIQECEAPFAPESQLVPEIKVTRKGNKLTIQLTGMREAAGRRFPDDLAYWEADWNFNGREFVSASQAARPWRGDLNTFELSGLISASPPGQLAVRVVTEQGEAGMRIAPIPAE
jgi:DNA modification methylase